LVWAKDWKLWRQLGAKMRLKIGQAIPTSRNRFDINDWRISATAR
jgi:hypothetical protein